MKPIAHLTLLTDLYELTMAAAYFEHDRCGPASFSLFVRRYPPGRNYFISAGLSDVLDYLSSLEFGPDDLTFLESTHMFKPEFLSHLENFRFTGSVDAMPEGRIFFADEPVLELTAPMIEAQIVETFVINAIGFQSMIATKASRCVHAAGPRKLVDFSLRRTQGTDAGMKVARASYIGGFIGSSNVLAGKHFGIPFYGTMAHSFITSFDDETEAFRAFVQTFPENSILLVDTYDTLQGTKKAVEVGKEMAARGEKLKGIRLDSGDMTALSRKARKILDEGGLEDTQIFASGAFDEYKIKKLLDEGAVIDSFGVGTKMGVSADAPYLDMAYKLVQYDGRPVLKLSQEKTSLAAEKQIFRYREASGRMKRDVIGLRDDAFPNTEPLLERVMDKGEILSPAPPLHQIREAFLDEFTHLDDRYKSIDDIDKKYPVSLSPRLIKLQSEVIRRIKEREFSGKP